MNKLIISALLMVGLVGMIGTAAAMPATADILTTSFFIGGGNVDSSTVVISDIDYAFGDPHTRHITVVTSTADTTIEARIYDSSDLTKDTGWVSTNDPSLSAGFTYSANSPNDYSFTVEVRGTTDGSITVYDNVGTAYTNLGGNDIADVSRGASIPEFPTVALPIAAILGLMFIISSRKKEE